MVQTQIGFQRKAVDLAPANHPAVLEHAEQGSARMDVLKSRVYVRLLAGYSRVSVHAGDPQIGRKFTLPVAFHRSSGMRQESHKYNEHIIFHLKIFPHPPL